MRDSSNSKKVLIIITKPPYAFEHSLGGAYMALAIADKGMRVSLLLMEDGVYCALKGQRSETISFEDLLYAIHSSGIPILIYNESLAIRGLKEEFLMEVCRVISNIDNVIDDCDYLLYY
ncbi:MAG: DsrE family protein [Candidatus Nezhaarchaeales archaeon]|nr:MAG: sulfur reduction protein DsrE [Candidatus Nezhaarchaeota archaeon WYZ-LMO7]